MTHPTWTVEAIDGLRTQRITREIESQFGDPKLATKTSEYKRLLIAISIAAAAQAAAEGNCEADRINHLIDVGFEFASYLRYSLTPHDAPDEVKRKLQVWSFRRDPLNGVRNKNIPHFDKTSIEDCVGQYLDLPYRSQEVDRLLADLLVALELYQFADEMINEEPVFGIGAVRSPLKRRHPLWSYFRARLIFSGITVVVIAGGIYLVRIGFLSQNLGFWIPVFVVGLWLLDLMIASIGLPFVWRAHAKSKAKVVRLLDVMCSCYSNFASNGPISVPNLRVQLDNAAAVGVTWPPPLYALLDDVQVRSGRI